VDEVKRGIGKIDPVSVRNKIYISEFDMKRLKGLIKFAEERWDTKGSYTISRNWTKSSIEPK
jgi:hypothetical protein